MNEMPGQANSGDKPKSFDLGIHYLRAFAIVCILLEHFWCYNGWEKESRAFLIGSTVYFLFISGYLCQYLSVRHPVSPKTYYRRKVRNVLCPYLVWTILTIVVVRLANETRCGVIAPDAIRCENIPEIVLFGLAQGPYWYIPFVCLLFLVSPRISRIRDSEMVRLSALFFFFAVCIPVRPVLPIENALAPLLMQYTYYAWSYLFGFLYARFKERVDAHLSGFVGAAIVLGLLLGLQAITPDCFTFGYPSFDSPEPATGSFVLGGALAQSLQKLFFLVPAVALANRLARKRISILDWLATYSFTLYFTHHFFVQDFVRFQTWTFKLIQPGTVGQTAIRLVVSALFIAFNLFFAVVLKRLIGRHSRCIIGA